MLKEKLQKDEVYFLLKIIYQTCTICYHCKHSAINNELWSLRMELIQSRGMNKHRVTIKYDKYFDRSCFRYYGMTQHW